MGKGHLWIPFPHSHPFPGDSTPESSDSDPLKSKGLWRISEDHQQTLLVGCPPAWCWWWHQTHPSRRPTFSHLFSYERVLTEKMPQGNSCIMDLSIFKVQNTLHQCLSTSESVPTVQPVHFMAPHLDPYQNKDLPWTAINDGKFEVSRLPTTGIAPYDFFSATSGPSNTWHNWAAKMLTNLCKLHTNSMCLYNTF